jgi:hypothetical protein
MSTKELILKEIDEAPEEFSSEVLELIRALKIVKNRDVNETTLLSQNILAKDWLTPEEDNAWKDL